MQSVKSESGKADEGTLGDLVSELEQQFSWVPSFFKPHREFQLFFVPCQFGV